MLKFELLLLKSVKNDVHGNMQTIIISVDITELNDYWIGNNHFKFCPSLTKTKEDQDKDAYPFKETSPCRVDFCTKRHHMSTRHFFVALPK